MWTVFSLLPLIAACPPHNLPSPLLYMVTKTTLSLISLSAISVRTGVIVRAFIP